MMTTSRPRQRKQRKQHGVMLLEVLMVVLLFAFGLLGMVALQAKALQVSVGAEDSNRAALLANEIASAMWAANSLTLPAATVTAWNTRVGDATVSGLPNGQGTVTVTGTVAEITITWRAPGEPSAASHRYTTQVQM